MKTFLLLSLLSILTACGAKGGGSSGSSAGNPNDTGAAETVYTYDIRIEGVAGSSIASNLVLNFGADDQDSEPVTVTLDGSQLVAAQFFGRNIFWEVQNTSGGNITVKIFKDGVEVRSETLTSNGQVMTLTDNL
jgi:predicted small lipoprotein YifL